MKLTNHTALHHPELFSEDDGQHYLRLKLDDGGVDLPALWYRATPSGVVLTGWELIDDKALYDELEAAHVDAPMATVE